LVGTLGLSLAAHGAVAAYLLAPPRPGPSAALAPPPQTAGDTFALPAPETADKALANASPSTDGHAAPAPAEQPDAPARPKPPSLGRPAPRPSHEGRPSAGRAAPGVAETAPGSAGTAALYGAVGDRSAADLAGAFTRAFPQAASGDASWRDAPLGPAGEATVTLTLDETGHISSVDVSGSPSAPLAGGIRRTMALIKGRPFVARGRVTRFRVVATISPDTVHDGLHGDVFAIGASVAESSAFFALNAGRRIDLRMLLQ
jgi:hypothetical protein